MNSTFKIEDASEGSPFGFDTTFLQDDPVEVKATERLKKSFKPKRVFESRLLVDPYVRSQIFSASKNCMKEFLRLATFASS